MPMQAPTRTSLQLAHQSHICQINFFGCVPSLFLEFLGRRVKHNVMNWDRAMGYFSLVQGRICVRRRQMVGGRSAGGLSLLIGARGILPQGYPQPASGGVASLLLA